MVDESPYHVFISYARVDEPWARAFADALVARSAGLPGGPWRVFIDLEALSSTDYWRRRLLDIEIPRCHAFIAVLSPEYMRSYNAERMCFHEYETAAHREMTGDRGVLFQVVHQKGEFTIAMQRKQWCDLSGVPSGAFTEQPQFARLLADLQRRIHPFSGEGPPASGDLASDAGVAPTPPSWDTADSICERFGREDLAAIPAGTRLPRGATGLAFRAGTLEPIHVTPGDELPPNLDRLILFNAQTVTVPTGQLIELRSADGFRCTATAWLSFTLDQGNPAALLDFYNAFATEISTDVLTLDDLWERLQQNVYVAFKDYLLGREMSVAQHAPEYPGLAETLRRYLADISRTTRLEFRDVFGTYIYSAEFEQARNSALDEAKLRRKRTADELPAAAHALLRKIEQAFAQDPPDRNAIQHNLRLLAPLAPRDHAEVAAWRHVVDQLPDASATVETGGNLVSQHWVFEKLGWDQATLNAYMRSGFPAPHSNDGTHAYWFESTLRRWIDSAVDSEGHIARPEHLRRPNKHAVTPPHRAEWDSPEQLDLGYVSMQCDRCRAWHDISGYASGHQFKCECGATLTTP